ncbi:MAG TPA: Asp-tRNA(Asn)/Glu-tRNA(Gln) amidotransferase subunit GatC [Phycisphaerae bacterium]|nr:Asp-tRNA(Asn)/Glu-tRNA(Gln) amidotransferase subunit GatC [Phycisphaerales bacterium]HRX86700.1 Asp-tRNA(Asn)/Glu-tRNA(Gln) amidotransferase subunit GatC [Phycisphaerae bacterium]
MADAVTTEEVRHIATLARLKLSDAEVERFTRELAAIIGYVEKLREVDVTHVEPTAHAVGAHNVFRDDVVQPSPGAAMAMANAPQKQNEFFRVPKVLDQDTV